MAYVSISVCVCLNYIYIYIYIYTHTHMYSARTGRAQRGGGSVRPRRPMDAEDRRLPDEHSLHPYSTNRSLSQPRRASFRLSLARIAGVVLSPPLSLASRRGRNRAGLFCRRAADPPYMLPYFARGAHTLPHILPHASGGNHLSNTTCLTHGFFKCDQ